MMMRKLLGLFIAVSFFMGCQQDDINEVDNFNPGIVVYKNQTGDSNASALQAQFHDGKGVFNFYGSFDMESDPETIKSFTYQKINNDTISNFILDPLTSKVTAIYHTVKGVNSDVVIKFDYTENDMMSVSFHNYNWGNNNSEIIFSTNMKRPLAKGSSVGVFQNKTLIDDLLDASAGDLGVALTGGFIAAEAVSAMLGGFGAGLFSGAAGAVAATAAAAAAAPVGALALALAAATVILSEANASELTPQDIPYPENTQIVNPVLEEDLTSDLTNPCINNSLSVVIGVDPGNVFTAIVNGNSNEYEFYWSTGEVNTAAIANTINAPESGAYAVLVKDTNGCMAYASANSEDNFSNNPIIGSWRVVEVQAREPNDAGGASVSWSLGDWLPDYGPCLGQSVLYSKSRLVGGVATITGSSFVINTDLEVVSYDHDDETCEVIWTESETVSLSPRGIYNYEEGYVRISESKYVWSSTNEAENTEIIVTSDPSFTVVDDNKVIYNETHPDENAIYSYVLERE